MMQPLILQQLLSKKDGISRQSGFLARSLIAYPESTMGTRHYKEPPKSLDALPAFYDRITQCLDSSLSLDRKGCHTQPTLTFSKKASSEALRQKILAKIKFSKNNHKFVLCEQNFCKK